MYICIVVKNMKSMLRCWNRAEERKRAKPVNGICRFCMTEGEKVFLRIYTSELGPDVLWCPRCGSCANWWLQTEYHFARMLSAYENKKKFGVKT